MEKSATFTKNCYRAFGWDVGFLCKRWFLHQSGFRGFGRRLGSSHMWRGSQTVLLSKLLQRDTCYLIVFLPEFTQTQTFIIQHGFKLQNLHLGEEIKTQVTFYALHQDYPQNYCLVSGTSPTKAFTNVPNYWVVRVSYRS